MYFANVAELLKILETVFEDPDHESMAERKLEALNKLIANSQYTTPSVNAMLPTSNGMSMPRGKL